MISLKDNNAGLLFSQLKFTSTEKFQAFNSKEKKKLVDVLKLNHLEELNSFLFFCFQKENF